MKKIRIVTLALMAIIITSCASAGDKASGTYNGGFTVNGNTYPGKIVVTKSATDKVNLALTCYSPALTDNSEGASASISGEDVIIGYSTTTSTAYDMASINGTLSGNTIVLDGIICLGGNSYAYGVFTGDK